MCAIVITFVPYVIMIMYYIKIHKYIKRHKHSLSTVSMRIQNDLNRILLAQAIVPIFSAFLPMVIHFLGAITDLDLVLASFICGILYSWIPAGNAFSVLLFVTAYRKKLKQLFLQCNQQLPRLISISATINNDT